jgi:hypothetical protein
MRKTRTEILTELQHRLGQSEQTEHLIDWVLDIWETRDLLVKRFGWMYASEIVEAVDSYFPALRLDDFVVCEPAYEEVQHSLLN